MLLNKHPLLKIIAIFFITLFVVTGYSLYDEDIIIELKRVDKPDFISDITVVDTVKTINNDSLSTNKGVIKTDSLAVSSNSDLEVDSLKKKKPLILMIGDSMMHGLSIRFNDYAAENGYDFKGVIWYSSSTKTWSQKDTLKHYIKRFKPDYIFFVIGGNELFVRDLNKRSDFVKNIEKQIGNIKSIWIGPPNWKKDTGINDTIVKIVGEDRFFPSKNLKYDRLKDGAHPTMSSASKWMDSIVVYVDSKSRYPLNLKLPEKKVKTNPQLVLLSPPK